MKKSSAEVASDLSPYRQALLLEAPGAISALSEIAANGETDTARVAAANSILDRIGLIKPSEPPPPSGLDPARVVDAMVGMASLFGRALSPEALQRIRIVTPQSPPGAVGSQGRGIDAGKSTSSPTLLNAPAEEVPEAAPKLPRRKRISIPKQEGQP